MKKKLYNPIRVLRDWIGNTIELFGCQHNQLEKYWLDWKCSYSSTQPNLFTHYFQRENMGSRVCVFVFNLNKYMNDLFLHIVKMS